ncbi:YjiH family protein [Peptoniphilus catoniae]|uniref:YjiH family protein n=1 Tax=Peptoniphilus catoniae TaxID=1660341 RepID=UPI0010FE2D45|nr:YjiH family protein [Peptoniphilus catoniae]
MENQKPKYVNGANILKFLIISALGIFMFFAKITVNGKNSIPVELIVSYIQGNFMQLCRIYALVFIILGAALPFVRKTWNKDNTTTVFSILKILGAIASIGIFFNVGPEAILSPDVGQYLFESLGVGLGVLIPVCAIFISFLISYGFVDCIGMIVRPITRAVWKTPGISAVDAISSFVGSSAMGIMITNGLYKEKKYTAKEASIIVTGFSAVAITFMVVVAETLGLMDYWNTFFVVALIVTFATTAITARIRPLRTIPDEYRNNEPGEIEEEYQGSLLKNAFYEGLKVCDESDPIGKNILSYLKDAMELVLEYLPNLMSIGLAGLLIAEYTQIFDILGYVFYPLTWALRIPEPLLAAKATLLGLAEMYLPVLLVVEAPLVTKFVVGIGSITGILMFSCTIPVILATEVPISLKDLVIVWIERAIISLIMTTLIALVIF